MKIAILILLSLCIAAITAHGGHSHSHDSSHSHSHSHDTDIKAVKKDVAKEKPLKQESHSHSHGHSHDHSHTHDSHSHSHESESINDEVLSVESSIPGGIWTLSFLATAIIGVAPVLLLEIIPLIKEEKDKIVINHSLLKTMLGFAVGGLLGDVFLHLIPHSISPHSHDGDSHSHSHSHVHNEDSHDHSAGIKLGLYVLGGMFTFFLLEKFMRIRAGSNSNGGHSHSHSHSHGNSNEKSKNDKSKSEKSQKNKKEEHSPVAAYLNIIADSAHNFTDGMAIAASFLISYKVGISTTIAVFFHEIPHEIGDYAILIQSGFTKNKAMLVQLGTALGAMAGTAFGLITGGMLDNKISEIILPFTAGGFIYIATVDVIPELLTNTNWKQTIKECFAIFFGVGMMLLIALYE